MQEEVARIVLALDSPEVAEEVIHFLDRTGRARVVGTATDERQLAEAIKQLEPDAVVAAPSMVPGRGELNGSALLALDTTQSVATLRRAIRAGASGFFLWPAEREELAVAAGRARPVVDVGIEGQAPVVAVYGARGGAGTTFVATHLAAALAKAERRCVLVDLDVVFADASAAVGVPTDGDVRTMADLVPLGDEISPVHVTEVMWRHPNGFGVLLAPGDELATVTVREHHYRAAVEAVRRTCDVVVLHVPRGLDAISRMGLELADRVVVVLGLDVLSFRDAKRAIAATGIEERCAFVVNRAARSEVAPSDVERVFGQAPLAVIPSDRSVRSAQDRGRLVPLRGRVGRQVQRLASRIVEEDA
jgi:Flp pilus assembly CpaE family ATPase